MPFFHTCGPNEAMVVSGAYVAVIKKNICNYTVLAKLCLSVQLREHVTWLVPNAWLCRPYGYDYVNNNDIAKLNSTRIELEHRKCSTWFMITW